MIARISSPLDELAAGCTGTACGASLTTLGARVLLLLLVRASGSSGSTRDCGVGALGGGGSGIDRGKGAGAGAGAAGIRESFFKSSLGSGGDRERTILGTCSLEADGAGGGGGGGGVVVITFAAGCEAAGIG